MVIGTLTIDGWAVTFDIVRRGLGGLVWVTAHPSKVYQLHIIQCRTIIINFN